MLSFSFKDQTYHYRSSALKGSINQVTNDHTWKPEISDKTAKMAIKRRQDIKEKEGREPTLYDSPSRTNRNVFTSDSAFNANYP